jgi:hypothetical protein
MFLTLSLFNLHLVNHKNQSLPTGQAGSDYLDFDLRTRINDQRFVKYPAPQTHPAMEIVTIFKTHTYIHTSIHTYIKYYRYGMIR